MDVTVGTDRQGVPTHAFTQEGPEARREWTVTEMRGRREVWLVRLRGKNGAPDVTAMLVCDPATRRWRMVRSLTVVA